MSNANLMSLFLFTKIFPTGAYWFVSISSKCWRNSSDLHSSPFTSSNWLSHAFSNIVLTEDFSFHWAFFFHFQTLYALRYGCCICAAKISFLWLCRQARLHYRIFALNAPWLDYSLLCWVSNVLRVSKAFPDISTNIGI